MPLTANLVWRQDGPMPMMSEHKGAGWVGSMWGTTGVVTGSLSGAKGLVGRSSGSVGHWYYARR